jgi:hypothetical protein
MDEGKTFCQCRGVTFNCASTFIHHRQPLYYKLSLCFFCIHRYTNKTFVLSSTFQPQVKSTFFLFILTTTHIYRLRTKLLFIYSNVFINQINWNFDRKKVTDIFINTCYHRIASVLLSYNIFQSSTLQTTTAFTLSSLLIAFFYRHNSTSDRS